ncbi:MAG: hypothetical protein EOR48_10525 [Mesorhizobium sp.]|nr:MAG: hypothetical protein EOR48_10525 [Mesorhizobium sp.]TIP39820.1 MAG: hypothetical protein E5X62_30035 [Mesorhizobium sp.]
MRDAGGTAPPSVLPDISPTWREIGSFVLLSPIANIEEEGAAGTDRLPAQARSMSRIAIEKL